MEPNFGWDLPAGVTPADFDDEPQRRSWRQRLWLWRYGLGWRLRRALRRLPAVEPGDDPFLPDFPDE